MTKCFKVAIITVFVIIFASCNCNYCNEKQCTSNKNEVAEVLRNQAKEWNNGNLDGFMEGYEKNDSTQFITQRGRVWGWQNIFDKYKKIYSNRDKMGKLSFEEMDVRFLRKNVAQVYGKWQVETDTVFGGVFSVFLRKNKNDWKIFIDHTW